MEIRPILSALFRNRAGTLLVGLQVALTLAVVANAFFIIEQRREKMSRPTGFDSANLFFVQSYGYSPSYRHEATVRADLALLRGLPGVADAAPIASVPMSGGGSATVVKAQPGPNVPQHGVNYFDGDERTLDALGLRLVAGRPFRAAEVEYVADNLEARPKVLLASVATASKLFGDVPPAAAVGRQVYLNDDTPVTIVGVYERMMGSWPGIQQPSPYDTVLSPIVQAGPTARYVVRTRPGELDRAMALAEQRLAANGQGRVITWVRPHAHAVERAYRSDHRMIVFLGTIVALMVAVTALGIVGLATFHVNARRKQIGTRRAVGARRIDIVRYFLVENGLLSGAGVLVGALFAYGFSWWLTSTFQLPPLHPGYVLATALGLAVLGQLAVLWPARRAAAIPPAVATRTV